MTPSTVTWRSAIASSSADCVRGIARLISSTSTMFAKIGPGPELELARLLVVDREPGDVGRLQIRRALDARELRAVDRLRDRAREDRLRRAGDVLEQDVPAGRSSAASTSAISSCLPTTTLLDVRDQAPRRLADRIGLSSVLDHRRLSHQKKVSIRGSRPIDDFDRSANRCQANWRLSPIHGPTAA